MKRHVILSANWNPDYLFYLPLCVWAWRKFGWEPVIFYHGKAKLADDVMLDLALEPVVDDGTTRLRLIGDIEPYRSDTLSQVSRLYGACVVEPDSYIMTGDIDMIPLSDYWNPDPNIITIYGHDLTGYSTYPICYIGMPYSKWVEVMGITGANYDVLMKRDLDSIPKASADKWEDYWGVDQDFITQRIDETNFNKEKINRTQYPNGYAFGRVDRGDWRLDHNQLIDAHLLRDIFKNPENLAKTLLLLYKVWPNEDFTWFVDYTAKFGAMAKKTYG